MKQKVMLSIRGRQHYSDHEPEVIELVTEGQMELVDGGYNIEYQESDLTGLKGVTTTFRVTQGQIELIRTGNLNSHMVFRQGIPHDSLYQMDFGALMITVTAKQLLFDLTQEGGFIDLVYNIEIEKSEAGTIDYHLDIRAVE